MKALEKQLTEKQKVIECIKDLSKRAGVLYDNLDYLMNYFDTLLKELEDERKN